MSNLNVNNDYFGNISNNYSASLSNEVAILQRKIYLPLLPLEKLNDFVLAAYRYLGESYWFKDDVFKAKEGNFYVPLLFPLIEDGESTDIINNAPRIQSINEDQLESSRYVTRNYINLTIPRSIILQFSNVIPKGTEFNISFFGGNDSNYTTKITSVSKTVPIPKKEFDDSLYDTAGMSFAGVVSLVENNLKKIRKEEKRRQKEEEEYERKRKLG